MNFPPIPPLLYRWIQIRNQNRLRIFHQWRHHPPPPQELCLHILGWTTCHLFLPLSHLSLLPPPHEFLLLSDSLSSLQAMQDPHSHNSIVNLCSSPKSLTPPSLLSTTFKIIIVPSSPSHGTTPDKRNFSPNSVQLKKQELYGLLFKPYISPWRNNYISIEIRSHPAHPLLSPTRTLLSTLMSVLPCRRNNCPSFLFMPISPKPPKILLCPVSLLFGSPQQLWNHYKHTKLPAVHILLQIHLIPIPLSSW